MKRVLVIDDSANMRQQIRSVLESAGYQVVEAVDGLDGLEKLSTAGDIALILCDLNMPRMNGLELMREVKRIPLTTPILVLTTEGQPAVIRRARDAGARGWIVKPFKPELLLMAVKKLVDAPQGEPRTEPHVEATGRR